MRADTWAQVAMTVVEASLRPPGEFDDTWPYIQLPLLERGADARSVSGVMRSLAEYVSQQAIAGVW